MKRIRKSPSSMQNHFAAPRRRRRKRNSSTRPSRPLRLEPLEDRRMLAVFTVDNLLDGHVFDEGDLPGSLRQAIFDANSTPGPDVINFEESLSGQSIGLVAGELRLMDSVVIDGSALSEKIEIDARERSRVVLIGIEEGDFALRGVVVTGGYATRGGGILSFTGDTLTLDDVSIVDNRAYFYGGGVNAFGPLSIENSSIRHNEALGDDGVGGGVATFNALSITGSLIDGNRAEGRRGGAIGRAKGLRCWNQL